MPDGTVKRLAQQMGKIVMQSADRQMACNTATDPVRSKWAIVAHPGACAWCVVYSSRGWEFNSEKTAKAQRHANCTCAVVADSDTSNPVLSGYDPDGMRDRYRECAEAVGSSDSSAVVAEMWTRDREWLRTGQNPGYTILAGATPTARELETARRLAVNGFKSEFRPRSDTVKCSDVYFVTGKETEPTRIAWEFKGPLGNGEQTIAHQFESAAGQCTRLVIDLTGIGPSWTAERALAEIEQKITRGYTVRSGAGKGENWFYDEVLVILGDGTVKRVKKEG